ncbi:hypothetical protein PF005_g15963 [Phytophthora fragariae]|uniref:RxLR effector protein n=2 Tax=Phytophthora TaxID=4783 RepID=A0A6A3KBY8_9STRA|nr:hypothetical protein PF003_g4220 [Phytophthora fragariae]KAE8987279.1 hypothetical protein PR002_g22096 [Phytophthora rubi]KAE8934654.1 hypothetical protein PF009_g15372 [Phytophthora fragariae]KAE8988223.1 hypothetical protein PR001_g22102 [Phytophthora rubi]KAE9003067.1 hypothetical protein PF011_g13050 [Phytophthora fragariae]
MIEGTKRIKRYQNWKAYGYNPAKIQNLNKLDGYDDLYQKYWICYYHRSG